MQINKKLFITCCLTAVFSFSLEASSADESFKNGEKIYNETCVSCHGENGETNPAMKLVVKPRQLKKTILTQEQSFKVIKEGAHHWGAHSDLMPAFKYIYSDAEIHDVAYFISKKFNPLVDSRVKKLLDESDVVSKKNEAKMLKTGKKIFNRNCSLCHGLTGNGKSAYVEQSKSSNNFIYPYDLRSTLLTEDQVFLYAKFGGHYWGTDKADMPSWKKKYNDTKLKSVAKYIEEKIKKNKE